MKDYFKYLTSAQEDIDWGLYLNVAGAAKILPKTLYTPVEQPSEYYFKWETGRILQEYQLNYITKGTGIYENKYGKFHVKPGSILLTFPNEWHRYRPIRTTGWMEKFEEIKAYCHQNAGSFIYASNYSIGVNLFFNLNSYLAQMMKNINGYGVEMEEIHHIHKLDAPSGTAISLAEDILDHSEKNKWTIDSPKENDLYINVKREGEVPGTHAVTYTSSIDAIEIKHTAFNREGFALGAVVAAEWLQDKRGIFNMKDVLGL